MKKTIKRIIASLLVVIMVFGSAPLEVLTGLDLASLFGVKAEAAGAGFQYPIRIQATDGQWYRLNKPNKAHKAIDLSAPTTTDVYSIGDGTVAIVYSDCKNYNGALNSACGCTPHKTYIKNGEIVTENGTKSKGYCNLGYGNGVVIDHHNGKYSHYAHLSTVNVNVGDSVTAETVLGKVGSSGNSEGPHLHFAYSNSSSYNGTFEDPFESCFLPWFKIYVTQNKSTSPIVTGEFPWKNNSFAGCGIEFGDYANNLNKKSADYNGKSNKHFYNLGKNFGELKIGKTYYFRLWLEKELDGRKLKYYSPVYSFKVGDGDIMLLDYSKANNTNVGTGGSTADLTYKLTQKVYDQYVSISNGFHVKDIPYEVGNNVGGKVSKGEYFEVFGVYENNYKNKWYKVKYNGVEGFVFHEHLTKVKTLSKLQYVPNYPKGDLNL
ncbi:MAG: M23 family metallopeptidase, partial [Clostridia bacterium]|nr:M23 family metallopeptidase [Clostridia bacterium]